MRVRNLNKTIDSAVARIYSRTREKAAEKVAGLPIAQDTHALNVKTDCALRTQLLQRYYPGVRFKPDDLMDYMFTQLLNNPNWDAYRRATTPSPAYLSLVASNDKDAEVALKEYTLLLEVADSTLDEYLSGGNYLPEIEEALPDKPDFVLT